MNFEEILDQVLAILMRHGRVSYRALKRQFRIDDGYLEDIKFELIEVRQLATDRNGTMLVWREDQQTPNLFPPSDDAHPVGSGSEQSADTPPTAEERRQLTVMFCDLVESTQLSGQLDPEDLRDVLREYQQLCATAIASLEGYIAQYLGDGILVYFGYPQAHEDDARRAVSSGLRIIEGMKRLQPQIEEQWGVKISVRVGIHTGLVIVGQMGTRDAPDPMAVVGAAPNIAERLQSVAGSNHLIISNATYRLVQGFFECQALGTKFLRGITEPMLVHRVQCESTAKNRFDVAAQGGLTPFVGRATEKDLLLKKWEAARNGKPGAVQVKGEAGIGKSRLAWELKEYVARASDTWLTEMRGFPQYQNSAFYPIIEVLQQFAFKFSREDTSAEKLVKIESYLIQYTQNLEEIVPIFADLLSVEFEPKYQPLNLTPERKKQKTIQTLAQIYLNIPNRQPSLLVIEDLHWIDASTLDVIAHLLSLMDAHKLLVLLTFRPMFSPPWPGQSNISTLQLKPLQQAESQAMIEQVLRGQALLPALLQQILQKTDGVPLFIEEVIKTLLESNILHEINNLKFDSQNPLPLEIPATIRDSLIARLEQSPEMKEVAQLCSTVGREFDYELIEAIAPWEQAILHKGLEQLIEAGLMHQLKERSSTTYQFKHALIQDTAYQSLVRRQRQHYHRRIAETLESASTETATTKPELLAHHFTEAGLKHQAIHYWQRAGQRALAQAANLEAIAHFTRGIGLLSGLPSEQRDQLEIQLQLGLAPAFMAIKGWASTDVERTCLRAKELSESVGDMQSLIASLWGLWTNYFLRGQLNPAKETATRVLQLAQQADQPMLCIIACHAIGYTCHFRGEFKSAIVYAEQALERFDLEIEKTIVLTFQFSSTVAIRMFMACSLWMSGYPDKAPALIDNALLLAQQLSHTPSQAYALASSCYFFQYAWDFQWVQEKSHELIEISLNEGFLLWHPVAMIFHGWSVAMQGRIEEGLAELNAGIQLFEETGTAIIYPHVMVMLAEVLIKAERFDEALNSIEAGIHQANERHEHHMEPELHRLKAESVLQRAMKQEDNLPPFTVNSVELSFHKAITLAQEQQALMLELRAVLGLGRLWRSQGKNKQAHTIVSNVYGRFTEGYQTSDLQAARLFLG